MTPQFASAAQPYLKGSPDSNKNRAGRALVEKSNPVMAQLMVFLNGLILTLTAFVTLNIFITDMNASEVKLTVSRIETAIKASVIVQQGVPIIDWYTIKAQHQDLEYLKIAARGGVATAISYGKVVPLKQITERTMDIGGRPWDIKFGIALRDGQVILGYVPILMLFFGMTLTAIGVLYARNNQRQSARLQKMNALLRDKNRDVRRQMDVNEQIMETLKASERDFSAIINSVNEVIFETDKAGRIVFVNSAWTTLTKLPPETMLGKSLFDYIYPHDVPELSVALKEMFLENLSHFRALTRVGVGDGQFRFAEIAFSLIRLDDAGNQRLVGMITDIEDRRQAEIALRETEKQYRTIVENAVSGLYQVGMDGKFLSANSALARMLGYDSKEAMLNDRICNKNNLFFDPKDRDLLMRLVKRQGQVKAFEVKYKKANGDMVWISESMRTVFDQNDEIAYYEGALDDITQRKEAEIAMQKSKLESDLANRAKTEFLQNMSHELRTPLNAIIGFSDIIHQESLGNIGTPAYLDYAREINAGGKQLLKIINEILDVSKIELTARPQNENALDLVKICDTCLTLVRGKGEEKLISIEGNIPAQLPVVIGSETAFKQMLLNLLHNAINYTPQGGHIALEAVLDQDHSMRLSISDNGVGMDAGVVKMALQPLDDINGLLHHETHNRHDTFSLSLVRSLITQHDGRLEIISEKGVGTTATLIVPASRIVGILDKANNNAVNKLLS